MAEPRFIAVLDVGKTNVKLALHDLDRGADLAVRTTPNVVRQDGPYPHFDTDAIQAFFLDGLADVRREGADGIDAISITAHGGSNALLGAVGLALPVLDYEHDGPDAAGEAYDRVRPPFSETCSPRLPCGLNVGAQVFWQQRAFPGPFAGVRHMVGYAQYWAWWLTGVAAQEATALGSHTDLWDPRARRFSSMVDRLGWASLMPSIRSAFDVLGDLEPDLARRLGFDRPVPVACGLHDSNASLLPHVMGANGPVTVVSTGTWVICFATGGSLDDLDPARDTLANVDAYARPTPSARFMGGREFEILAGKEAAAPDAPALASVLDRRVMAWPTFSPGTGPFPREVGRWSHPPETLSAAERAAAASLYAALVTATSLTLVKARGSTIVEGPFARNPLYLAALERLTGRPVLASRNATGTTGGAALLFRRNGPPPRPALEPAVGSLALGPAFDAYALAWNRAVNGAA